MHNINIYIDIKDIEILDESETARAILIYLFQIEKIQIKILNSYRYIEDCRLSQEREIANTNIIN